MLTIDGKLYSDEAPELCPPNASPAFPRIIASPESLGQDSGLTDLHLPDVVATHLYKWNPEALRNFLDLHRGKFEYVLERPGHLTLLIARLGQKIQVSERPNIVHCPNNMFEQIELHSDGYTDGSATITYLLSTTGEWKTTFGYMGLSPTYDPPQVEEYAKKLAMDLLKSKGWVTGEGKVHKILWTKLPGEAGFKVPYDSEQQEFYGLPPGWEGMDDDEIARVQKHNRAKQPYEERDKWAFELIAPTTC